MRQKIWTLSAPGDEGAVAAGTTISPPAAEIFDEEDGRLRGGEQEPWPLSSSGFESDQETGPAANPDRPRRGCYIPPFQ